MACPNWQWLEQYSHNGSVELTTIENIWSATPDVTGMNPEKIGSWPDPADLDLQG